MVYASSVLVLSEDGLIFAACRNPGAKVFPGRWECPTGKLDPGEGFIEAALRELEEESGLKVEASRLLDCGSISTFGPGPATAVVGLYMVRLRPGERLTNPEPDKRGNWLAMSLKSALRLNNSPAFGALLAIKSAD